MIKKITLLAILAFSISALAEENSKGLPSAYQISGTELHRVQSEIVNQSYELIVALPSSYAKSPNARYPVVYVLDGQWNFAMAEAIAGKLGVDGFMPEVIVVGIAWGGKGADPVLLRQRDFTPEVFMQWKGSGGAGKFLDTLERELIPYIEKRYRTAKDRTIAGSSLGGLFVSYALFERPHLFDKYVASAPALWAVSDGFIQQKLKQMMKKPSGESIRLFIGCGLLDYCKTKSEAMANAITNSGMTDIKVEFRLIEDIGHSSVEPINLTYGLKFVFSRTPYEISDAALAQLAGFYALDGDFTIDVSPSLNGFFAKQSNGLDIRFYAESPTRFYAYGMNATIEFMRDDKGPYMSFNTEGNQMVLRRPPK